MMDVMKKYDTLHRSKNKFSAYNFFSKYEQIRSSLRICSHILK